MNVDGPDENSVTGEGLVEEYIMAREEAEDELKEFYKTAGPGDEPDQNSAAMIDLRTYRELLKSAGLPAKELATLLEGDPGLLAEKIGKNIRRRSIQKRTYDSNESRRWTGGIVPYFFTSDITAEYQREILRAMQPYERFTCLRFLPWEEVDNITTNQKLGLDHESYLRFINGSGCYSLLGNVRKEKGGQSISCCSGKTCVHELGHALGESHEQQTPNPDRFRMIRTNFENIKPDYRSAYANNSASKRISLGYDLSSIMHYTTRSFRLQNKETYIKFFPELPNSGNFHYLLREVSLMHKCQDRCSDFPLICENDGYLTLVDNKCACVCIHGLDPDSGCTKVLKTEPEGLQFPGGNYALPALSSGCPDESFTLGSRTQVNDGKNMKSYPYSLGGYVTQTKVEQKFCIKKPSPNDIPWTSGNFCIYRRGGKCPRGFKEGFVQYNDNPTENEPNAITGEMPDGVFEDDTRYEYCCAYTGFADDLELFLPSRKRFALIRRRQSNCQSVRGMHIESNIVRIQNSEGSPTESALGGDHPVYHINKKTNVFSTSFCVYKPAMTDCGDIIQVDSSNSEVEITSPQAPELECFWLIKAPPGERLQLDFTDFDIKGKPGFCADKLEVGYVRPGQPGLTLCGSRWDKTIISINNTIHLRLSTYGDSPSGFTAKIKLVKDADLCYAASDRGMTYDGDVSFTRDFEPCLPWAKVSHCEMNPFRTDRFTAILEDNKCRNPDQGTGFQPWCYTDANGCLRNYCDVCLIGKRFDILDNCAELKSEGQCNQKFCAKTCADQSTVPNVPVKASEVTCAAPGAAPDGTLVDATKASYAVGESVTYKCNYGAYTSKRYCLTSGQWSPMGTACLECPNGYHLNENNKQCYFFPEKAQTFADARAFCKANGNAVVAFPVTKAENTYLRKLTTYHFWIGITDEAKEGDFLTELGEPLTFTKWAKKEPNNKRNQDCTEVMKNGKWNDFRCTKLRHYFCQTPMTPLEDCLDRSDKCAAMFATNPSSCSDFSDFAEFQCRFTCGLCDTQKSPPCHVNTAGVKSNLGRGETVTDSCAEGYIRIAGDAVRGCTASGTLTGSPLECVKTCPRGWTLNEENLQCYRMFTPAQSKSDALATCEGLKGMLTTAKDKKETDFILSFKNQGFVWMGLSEVENKWMWEDGMNLLWTNWNTAEQTPLRCFQG